MRQANRPRRRTTGLLCTQTLWKGMQRFYSFASRITVEHVAAYFLQVRRHMRLSPHEPAQQMVRLNDVVLDPDLTYRTPVSWKAQKPPWYHLKILKTATTRRHRNLVYVHLDVCTVHGRMVKLYDSGVRLNHVSQHRLIIFFFCSGSGSTSILSEDSA